MHQITAHVCLCLGLTATLTVDSESDAADVGIVDTTSTVLFGFSMSDAAVEELLDRSGGDLEASLWELLLS